MVKNTKINEYDPDIVSHPGTTLNEILESLNMKQKEFAKRVGRPHKTINEIIKGKTAITPDTALQFEKVLRTPASFWINREKNYREYLAKKKNIEELNMTVGWLDNFSVNEMSKLGWIDKFRDKVSQLDELLKFFGIAKPSQWNLIWESTLAQYRQSTSQQLNEFIISAWLRQGEIIAQTINTDEYDKKKYLMKLKEIRSLTTKQPEEFVPIIQDLCSQSGVALVLVRELKSLKTSGATRWLSSKKALIQLSLRYKTNDQLWFTFFHEAGHIVLHNKDKEFYEIDNKKDIYEKEADDFAKDILISDQEYKRFLKSSKINRNTIRNFAKEIQIHPGIVVGRLQHDKYLDYKTYNDLKERYVWSDS